MLHLAPHPDDESIAAPATLIGLTRAGHRVINLACSLGRPDQAARRHAEADTACRRAGFTLVVHDPPLGISSDDDLDAAREALAATVTRLAEEEEVDVIVAPSPHDGHHGHEVVGRAARDAVRHLERAPRLWMWGLWADLPFPTLYSAFGHRRLLHVLYVLNAHRGEVSRNGYRALVAARGIASRVLGSERVFGYGSPMRPTRYAELLTEIAVRDGVMWLMPAREP